MSGSRVNDLRPWLRPLARSRWTWWPFLVVIAPVGFLIRLLWVLPDVYTDWVLDIRDAWEIPNR